MWDEIKRFISEWVPLLVNDKVTYGSAFLFGFTYYLSTNNLIKNLPLTIGSSFINGLCLMFASYLISKMIDNYMGVRIIQFVDRGIHMISTIPYRIIVPILLITYWSYLNVPMMVLKIGIYYSKYKMDGYGPVYAVMKGVWNDLHKILH
jgi:hypothetical protein